MEYAVGLAVLLVLFALFRAYKRYQNYLPHYRSYWNFITLTRRIRFHTQLVRFRTYLSIKESKSRFTSVVYGSIFLLFRSSSKLLFGFLFGLFVLELSRTAQTNQNQSIFTSLTQDVPLGSNETYDGILTAVLTFVGIFIPLYLTNLTSVIEEKYSELPAKIRTLILRERIENVAVDFVFFLTAYNLTALVYSAALGSRPIIAIVIATVLGGLSVPMLVVHFTQQSSIFRNPVTLSNRLFNELIDWSKQATTKGYAWNDDSFQVHYHKQATLVIQGLQSLADLLAQEGHRKALITLVEAISRFLPFYLLNVKPQIPENSRWFEQVIKFNDWYLADGTQSTTIMTASDTQTSLPPNFEPDYEWLEKKLLVIVERAISHLTQEQNFEAVSEVLAMAFFAYREIGMVWQISTAEASLIKIAQAVYQQMIINIEQPPSTERYDVLVRMQTVENLNVLPTQVLLGLFASLQTVDVAKLSGFIEKANWRKPQNIYELGLPREAYSGLEYLVPRLQFELDIEGHIISATWYNLQTALQPIAQGLKSHLNHLIQFGQSFYLTNGKLALSKGQGALAVMSLSRGLEFFNKLDSHIDEAKALVVSIDEKRILKDIPWPQWDWSAFEQQIQAATGKIISQMAECIPSLVEESNLFSEDYPDLLGQALNTIGEACFNALSNNQTSLMSSLFENYIVGLLKKQENISKRVQGWRNPYSAIVLGTEPFAELLELSGYAVLYSEYYQNPELWQSVKTIWDNYLRSEDNRTQIAVLIYQISLARQQIGITSRQMIRDQWTRIFGSVLNTIELVRVQDTSVPFFEPLMMRNHPSLLIRTIAGSDEIDNLFSVGRDAASVFMDLYMNTIVNFKNMPQYHFEDIKESMDAQKEREAELNFTLDSEDHTKGET